MTTDRVNVNLEELPWKYFLAKNKALAIAIRTIAIAIAIAAKKAIEYCNMQ